VEDIEFQDVGKVLVTASLSTKVRPKLDATARLATVGLVADAVIVFNPGASAEPLPEGRVIQGTVDRGLTDLGADLGAQAKDVLGGIQEVANKRLGDDLHETLAILQRTLSLYANQQKGPSAELTEALRAIQRVGARLDTTLQRAQLDATLRRSDTLVNRLAATSAQFTTTGAQLDSLLRRLNSGDGTLGKLMNDSLLYGDLRRVSKSLQSLIDTLAKHPGKITVQVKVF
jgi:phospholipid/cholesterol/gamma-HCH transport system substrate-binding protein